MLPSHSLPLRSALTILKPQPLLLPPSCAFSTTSQRRFFTNPSTRPSTPHTIHKPHHHHSAPLIRIRFESTTATPLPPSTPSSTSTFPSASASPSQLQPLTWNAYLSLRKTRRRYSLVSSLLSALCTAAGGMSFLSRFSMEQVSIFGVDPFAVIIMAVIGSGGVGWLVGPFWGNEVFGIMHRRLGGQIAEKEVDFYKRIKKHRVDPSGGSSANPVPDYYGEKIGSVKEYRNWMKDQRAFNKRRQNFL